jgi:hypothetical protein
LAGCLLTIWLIEGVSVNTDLAMLHEPRTSVVRQGNSRDKTLSDLRPNGQCFASRPAVNREITGHRFVEVSNASKMHSRSYVMFRHVSCFNSDEHSSLFQKLKLYQLVKKFLSIYGTTFTLACTTAHHCIISWDSHIQLMHILGCSPSSINRLYPKRDKRFPMDPAHWALLRYAITKAETVAQTPCLLKMFKLK